ncbi:MAG TPA: molybdopterin converting factor subunit 1 [Blastocatellia bacterium]|nr:molybdopterin converting factor subunit 1 [Blastocatellia bacterium]
MKVNILFFGACREAIGLSEDVCDLPQEATVSDAFKMLKEKFPQLERFERSALFAVNEEHSPKDQALREGDTLAIFPPVSGG